jgi:hypothetical protein
MRDTLKGTGPDKPPSEPNPDRRSTEPRPRAPSEPDPRRTGSDIPSKPIGEPFKGTRPPSGPAGPA